MGVTLVFLLGLVGVVFILFKKNTVLAQVREDGKLVKFLQSYECFMGPYKMGIFIFILNALFTGSVAGVFYTLSIIYIPYLHIIVMVVGTAFSILSWSYINVASRDEKRNRIKMASLGSSFYVLLGLFAFIKLITLKPTTPNEDMFMLVIGLLSTIIIAIVAAITCFVFTGFPSKGKSTFLVK